jgi:hypothetical protein
MTNARGGNLDLHSSQIKKSVLALKEIDFELAYLALLSREGLKPLSRWEKSIDRAGLGLLQRTGLLTKQIRRTAKTGKQVIETIFSPLPAYIELYEHRFGDRPIDKSAEAQRLEGFLFGYPPCCVNRYLEQPYAPNNLTAEEQRILFHWACQDCKITPILLHAYKRLHEWLDNC